MENPSPLEGVEKLGGSMRVNGEAVLRRLRIPIRFLVGERPAGAERGAEREVSSLGAGERTGWIGRRGEETGLRDEKSWGEGGALVRKKLTGLTRVSFELPSGHLERLGEKIMGAMFSALQFRSSASKAAALRLMGEERVEEIARWEVRFMLKD
jgi:hypothetical protein